MLDITELTRCFEAREPQPLGIRHRFAVLCPLLETADGLQILFEVRSPNVPQGGEVCFPGGGQEPGETPDACALRETEEELSIPSSEIQLLGQADFIVSGNLLLRPYIGLVSPQGLQAMRPSPAEVSETFTVPLSFFQNNPPRVYTRELEALVPEDFPFEELHVSRDYPWKGSRVEIPVWVYENRVIWGLTARILRGIVAALEN